MARIFLSYARKDAAKTAALAKALERSGHQIWWDPQVEGGTRFAAAIAEALKNAELVIVLWSRHSVDSTWVQDEAAEGRDTGRLIPILLDETRPPLGFRQFQAIDLSRWKGRGRVGNFAAIEKAVDTVLSGGTLASSAAERTTSKSFLKRWPGRTAAAGLALLAIAGGTLYGVGRLSTVSPTTLAVMPFADFSSTKDKAYLADGVAEEIRSLLSDVDGVRVTGRTSTEMLGPTADFRRAREQPVSYTHLRAHET